MKSQTLLTQGLILVAIGHLIKIQYVLAGQTPGSELIFTLVVGSILLVTGLVGVIFSID